MRHLWYVYLTSKVTKLYLHPQASIVGAIIQKVKTGDKNVVDYPTLVIEAPVDPETSSDDWVQFTIRLVDNGEMIAPDEQYVSSVYNIETGHYYIIYAVYPKVEKVAAETT